MFNFCYVLLLLSIVTYTYAAVALYPEETKPAEFASQEGCYLAILGKVLPYDEPYYPRDNKTCVQFKCSKATNLTQLVTCGAIEIVHPGCPLFEDLSKDYPDCCPKNNVCPSASGIYDDLAKSRN